jgi:glucokinase
MELTKTNYYLIGDIGGTNCRFDLIEIEGG